MAQTLPHQMLEKSPNAHGISDALLEVTMAAFHTAMPSLANNDRCPAAVGAAVAPTVKASLSQLLCINFSMSQQQKRHQKQRHLLVGAI